MPGNYQAMEYAPPGWFLDRESPGGLIVAFPHFFRPFSPSPCHLYRETETCQGRARVSIIRKTASGMPSDKHQFTRVLYEKYKQIMYDAARCPGPQNREDVMQESVARLCEKAERLRDLLPDLIAGGDRQSIPPPYPASPAGTRLRSSHTRRTPHKRGHRRRAAPVPD